MRRGRGEGEEGKGAGGVTLLSNDRSCRQKAREGLKERRMEAGYSITATKRKASAEVGEEE